MVKQQEWEIDEKIERKWFQENKDNFVDNGRSMEQLLSLSKIAHAKRIYGKDPAMKKRMSLDDIQEGYKMYEENMRIKKDKMLFGLYI